MTASPIWIDFEAAFYRVQRLWITVQVNQAMPKAERRQDQFFIELNLFLSLVRLQAGKSETQTLIQFPIVFFRRSEVPHEKSPLGLPKQLFIGNLGKVELFLR